VLRHCPQQGNRTGGRRAHALAPDTPARLTTIPHREHNIHVMTALTLSAQQDLELRFRSVTARDLLATGVRVLRQGGLSETNRDSVTTTLAVGLGRLYELALGLHALNTRGRWETPTTDASDSRPDLLSMHDAVFDSLSLSSSSPSQEVAVWLGRISTDPVVPGLVEALAPHWAAACGAPNGADGAPTAWGDIEQVAQQDLGDYELNILGGPNGEPAEYMAWRRSVQASRGDSRRDCGERLAGTVETIWFTLGFCGREGILGQPGRVFAAEVLPTARAASVAAA